MSERVVAVILAAGCGSRMRLGVTKQRIVIGDESVLRRTVRIFNDSSAISSIVVVVRKDEMNFAEEELLCFDKVAKITVGGETRFESAKIGFALAEDFADYVAIHDAARCFVTDEIIKAVVSDAIKFGAATAASAITDTVKTVDSDGMICGTVDRNSLMLVQTPQVFRSELYKKALLSADVNDSAITDDNMLVERIGGKIHCTDTGKYNIKLTHKEDLDYADFLLNGEK